MLKEIIKIANKYMFNLKQKYNYANVFFNIYIDSFFQNLHNYLHKLKIFILFLYDKNIL